MNLLERKSLPGLNGLDNVDVIYLSLMYASLGDVLAARETSKVWKDAADLVITGRYNYIFGMDTKSLTIKINKLKKACQARTDIKKLAQLVNKYPANTYLTRMVSTMYLEMFNRDDDVSITTKINRSIRAPEVLKDGKEYWYGGTDGIFDIYQTYAELYNYVVGEPSSFRLLLWPISLMYYSIPDFSVSSC